MLPLNEVELEQRFKPIKIMFHAWQAYNTISIVFTFKFITMDTRLAITQGMRYAVLRLALWEDREKVFGVVHEYLVCDRQFTSG